MPIVVVLNRFAANWGRQADAAVRGRVSRHRSGVQRDAVAGDLLHVGHRRVVVFLRAVVPVLGDDREAACRRLAALASCRDRGDGDQGAAIVSVDHLVGQAEHEAVDRRSTFLPQVLAVFEGTLPEGFGHRQTGIERGVVGLFDRRDRFIFRPCWARRDEHQRSENDYAPREELHLASGLLRPPDGDHGSRLSMRKTRFAP